MSDREKLEALFQLESQQLGLIEQTNERVAATNQKNKQIQALAEKLVYETKAQLFRNQMYDLQQTYMVLIASAKTKAAKQRLIDHYENRVVELRELISEEV